MTTDIKHKTVATANEDEVTVFDKDEQFSGDTSNDGISNTDPHSPVKAIRLFCIDCMGGSYNEVRDCPSTSCPLHAFRFGKNPYRAKRELTEEQKLKQIELGKRLGEYQRKRMAERKAEQNE